MGLEPGEMGEYERLTRWIAEDLADICDPDVICELDGLLASVERSACGGGSVKQAFIDAFFARDRVGTALAEIVDPAAMLRRRLLHREPLPTLDALVVFAPDPRSRSQLERAAALTYAALDLHRSGSWGASPVLGITQVPGLDADRLIQARARGDLAVLRDGRPYLVSAAIDLSLDELMGALAWIQRDAAGRAPSRLLGALTAATRPTCHALRARLVEDPRNAEAIAAIEGAVLVLCLDGASKAASTPAPATAASGLFSTRTNRWYGAPELVVDAHGHAGLIESYTRGINAGELLQFADALCARARSLVGVRSDSAPPMTRPDGVVPYSLVARDDDPVVQGAAEAEAATAFHGEPCSFSLSVDRSWFKARRLSPNAALQYLLILTAHDTWGGATPPTLTQAVRRTGEDGTLDWILVPTLGLDRLRLDWLRRSMPDDRLFSAFRAYTARLAARVEACKQAPSPCLLFSRSTWSIDQQLVSLFLRVAERHDSGYRGYLFRATRAPGTIDLITSTLTLPASVAYVGRPGATNHVASKFGLHILPRGASLDIIYIPHPGRSRDLPRFHARLEQLHEALHALEEVR